MRLQMLREGGGDPRGHGIEEADVGVFVEDEVREVENFLAHAAGEEEGLHLWPFGWLVGWWWLMLLLLLLLLLNIICFFSSKIFI